MKILEKKIFFYEKIAPDVFLLKMSRLVSGGLSYKQATIVKCKFVIELVWNKAAIGPTLHLQNKSLTSSTQQWHGMMDT